MTDFALSGGGTIYLLTPLTDAAQQWVNEHLPSDARRFGFAIVIEHRYIEDIIDGIRADGLSIE